MIKKREFGDTPREKLLAARRDRLYNFMLAGGTIRGAVVNGTRMVNEMRWNHELDVLETLVLGHAYLGATLASAALRSNDRLSIRVECSGPIKGLTVEANAYGEVRGYLKQVPIPVDRPLDSFNLKPFWGAGFLFVTKTIAEGRQPFTGQVMLEHGSLAKDLSLYFLKSEQIPTAIHLSVFFDPQGEVRGAGGLLLQALPGTGEEKLVALEEQVYALSSMGQSAIAEEFPEKWLHETFGDFGPKLLADRRIEFMCRCSLERVHAMLYMLPLSDLAEMAETGPFPVTIRCHHCNSSYLLEQTQLRSIHAERLQESDSHGQ
jgi:molecular chaperone Hsp33